MHHSLIVDKILKSILKRQIPFLIGGTITGTIMTYYYGFLFTIIVNSAIGMVYLTSLTDSIGKTKDLTTKSTFFNMQCQKSNREKGKLKSKYIIHIITRFSKI
jgi:hypothetical protein